jgi:hypothetical protein
MRERRQRIRQTDQQELGVGMRVQETATGYQRDTWTMVAPHAINSKRGHAGWFSSKKQKPEAPKTATGP